MPDRARLGVLAGLVAMVLPAGCRTPRALEELVGPEAHARPATQALIGASLLDRADYEVGDISDSSPALTTTTSFETIPTFGVAGMKPLTGGELHVGIEGAMLFSIGVASADLDTGGGTLDVDTALWLGDFSIGPYISTSMARDVRAFAGAGATMMLGYLEVESDSTEEDPDGSAFGIGGYARAGVELRLGGGGFLGLSVRAVSNDLDFSGPIGDGDFDGVQLFLTYTTDSTMGW